MKYLIKAGLLVMALFTSAFIYSQIAIAVSKNDNGSVIKYSLEVGNSLDEAYDKAQKTLESQSLKNIFILKSSENTGHDLKSGFYVLIVSSRKSYGGKFFVSYGLGGSTISRDEAIQRAVLHLKENDWGYENGDPYAFEKEGKIEDLFVVKEKK